MARLYFFAIGGTGARVLRALTHLLATGLDMGNFELVPVMIDADQQNGDTRRALTALNLYRRLREGYASDVPGKGDFFATPVIRPGEALGAQGAAVHMLTDFNLSLQDVADRTFKDYIRLSALSPESQAMARLLFSETDLSSHMVVGFEGRPHMGTVVLNQLPQSTYYRNFAQSFAEGDRIFIAGSIFGGTGAAGLPVLVKNIREATLDGNQAANLRNAPIGALVALPYYGLQDAETGKGIDGHKFRTMAKAALSYYEKNLIKNGTINRLYTIGDDPHAQYPNEKGGDKQTNPAHLVEIAAALAVADFATASSGDMITNNGRAQSPSVLEFGTKNPPTGHRVLFDDLAQATRQKVERGLTKYLLFEHYIRRYFADRAEKLGTKGDPVQFDERFRQLAWFQDLEKYNQDFAIFLGELARNKDAFHPFAIQGVDGGYQPTEEDIMSLVYGRKHRPGLFGKSGPTLITDEAYKAAKANKSTAAEKAPLRFLQIFNKALEAVLD
ncbi:hypothetical protein WDZ92_01190 [Nostoc sp. NIES-2111]